MCMHRLLLVRCLKENIKDNMKENEKGTQGKGVSDPLLLLCLLRLGLIAVNRADGVQRHLGEGFMRVRVGEQGVRGVDGWERC